MVSDQSLWVYVANAGPVVKLVMLILSVASIISWSFIIQRMLFFKKYRQSASQFEEKFWSGIELSNLFKDIEQRGQQNSGMNRIFYAGFKEYMRLMQSAGSKSTDILVAVQRSMRVANARELEKLELHLPFLASVGSVSPYIGLFGTVWGIMTAFHALGGVQQASIAMVAPGISEALIATAMGLFAAIPAVLAYNRYTSQVERLLNRYERFQEEFSSILQRQPS